MAGKTFGPSEEKRLQVMDRRKRAFELRMLGMTYPDILALLQNEMPAVLPPSYDTRLVHQDVQTELRNISKNHATAEKDMRTLEAMRVDQLQLFVMNEIQNNIGEKRLKAVDRMLKIMDYRARLFGLYSPNQVTVRDWRSELIDLIKSGRISRAELEAQVGEELAGEIIESGSIDAIEGRIIEARSGEEESVQPLEDLADKEHS